MDEEQTTCLVNDAKGKGMKGHQMNEVFLSKGSHPSRRDGMCAMEFGAYLAGLEHTDEPACVSPVLLEFMINLNDSLDDEKRQRLRPYIVRTLGTTKDGQDERRSYMALDWLVRIYTPAFLELGGLGSHASELRNLSTIEDHASAEAAAPKVRAARDAARAAAWAAAWAALQPTVESLQRSNFELLDRMIDPGGLHDVKTEAEWLAGSRTA